MRAEHFDELEADFQQYYNLDVALLPPAKAARLLFQLPRDCRVYSKIRPEVQWGWQEIFMNRMMYHLDTLVWMKTKDAQKRVPQHRPKIFTPPFMPQQSAPGEVSKGAEAHDTEDIRDLLNRRRVSN